jgi:hypothetical protein
MRNDPRRLMSSPQLFNLKIPMRMPNDDAFLVSRYQDSNVAPKNNHFSKPFGSCVLTLQFIFGSSSAYIACCEARHKTYPRVKKLACHPLRLLPLAHLQRALRKHERI